MTRAVIWTRVSTDGQEDGTSLDTQLDECRSHCAANGWDVVREFRIVHSIKYLEDIPEFRVIRDMITAREVDVFVALKFDRITGDERDIAILDRLCERHGVRISLVQDDVGDGDHASIIKMLNGFFGRKRLETTREATRRGLIAKMTGDPERGVAPRPLGAQWCPFGLKWADDFVRTNDGGTRLLKQRFEPNPATIDTLRSIFRWYDEGDSLRGICKRLESLGIPSHTGQPQWNAPALRYILRNENYVGIGYAGKTGKPREEWIELPEGTFPKIIDGARFARVQERLRNNRHECAPGNRDPEVGLLRRGLGVCGYCGKPLHVLHAPGGVHYRCFPSNKDRHKCPGYSMSVTKLDDQVWGFARQLILKPEALEAKLFGEPTSDPTLGALPIAEAEIKRLTQQRDRVQRHLRDADDDALVTAYENDLKTILAEIHAAETRYRFIQAEHEAWRAGQEQRQSVLDDAAQLRDQLDDLDWHGRRNILMRIGARIRLYRSEDADPRWSISTRFIVGKRVSIDINHLPSGATLDQVQWGFEMTMNASPMAIDHGDGYENPEDWPGYVSDGNDPGYVVNVFNRPKAAFVPRYAVSREGLEPSTN
jgi:site-specific DNA recombinase